MCTLRRQELKTDFLMICNPASSCQVAVYGGRMNLGISLGRPHDASTSCWIRGCVHRFHVWHLTNAWVQASSQNCLQDGHQSWRRNARGQIWFCGVDKFFERGRKTAGIPGTNHVRQRRNKTSVFHHSNQFVRHILHTKSKAYFIIQTKAVSGTDFRPCAKFQPNP